MWKLWCIRYTEKSWLGYRAHFMEMGGHRIDSVIRDFHDLKPNAEINEIYVEYKER